MRVISEERLKQIAHETQNSVDTNLLVLSLLNSIISECKEPNSWIPLKEFLRSGFTGLCWIEFPSALVTDAYFDGYLFKFSSTSDFAHDGNYIARVMPIHKPEPPR